MSARGATPAGDPRRRPTPPSRAWHTARHRHPSAHFAPTVPAHRRSAADTAGDWLTLRHGGDEDARQTRTDRWPRRRPRAGAENGSCANGRVDSPSAIALDAGPERIAGRGSIDDPASGRPPAENGTGWKAPSAEGGSVRRYPTGAAIRRQAARPMREGDVSHHDPPFSNTLEIGILPPALGWTAEVSPSNRTGTDAASASAGHEREDVKSGDQKSPGPHTALPMRPTSAVSQKQPERAATTRQKSPSSCAEITCLANEVNASRLEHDAGRHPIDEGGADHRGKEAHWCHAARGTGARRQSSSDPERRASIAARSRPPRRCNQSNTNLRCRRAADRLHHASRNLERPLGNHARPSDLLKAGGPPTTCAPSARGPRSVARDEGGASRRADRHRGARQPPERHRYISGLGAGRICRFGTK